jgi:hypothetical protein
MDYPRIWSSSLHRLFYFILERAPDVYNYADICYATSYYLYDYID